MDQSLVDSIRKNLEARPTEELRQAYESPDKASKTPEELEAMRQLLEERRTKNTKAALALASAIVLGTAAAGFAWWGASPMQLSSLPVLVAHSWDLPDITSTCPDRIAISGRNQREGRMSIPETTSRTRWGLWLKMVVGAFALLGLWTGVFFGWTALETYVFAERIHLLTSEKNLRIGMSQEEVEDLFGVKPEDRKPPDPRNAMLFPPPSHDGVKRNSEMKGPKDNVVDYTGWYHGIIVTSQHHVVVWYDAAGKVEKWNRGRGN